MKESGQSGQTPSVKRTLDDLKKEKILSSLKGDSTVEEACQAAGVGRSSYYEWLQKDREFAKAVAHAPNAAVRSVEDALFVTAMSGNIAAIKFFLKNRAPDRWREKPEADKGMAGEETQIVAQVQTGILENQTVNGQQPPAEKDIQPHLP